MEIEKGSIWEGRCGEGQVKINFTDDHCVNYSYLDEGEGDFDMKHDDFTVYFRPVETAPRDTKDDITVGSIWKDKLFGDEYTVGEQELETGDVTYTDGETYGKESQDDFLRNFEFISVGMPDAVVGAKQETVNSPSHYNDGQVECIDAIRAALTDEEFRGFCKGNVLKYTWREKHKGGNESLEKAVWYLKQMVGE